VSTNLLLSKLIFDPADFPEPEALADTTWEKLSTASTYFFRARCAQEVPAMLAPLVILAERSGISSCRTKKSIAFILRWMVRRKETFWQWDQETWKTLLSARLDSRPYVAAVAYHFGMLREPVMFGNAGIYAEAIFGSVVFHQELGRLRSVLQSLGYAQAPLHAVLPSLLGHLMLENGDPRLETFTADLLVRGQAHRVASVARGVGKVSHGLAAHGIIETPIRMLNYRSWHDKDTSGIHSEWSSWCGRWRETSTKRPRTRESNYSFILRMGLWLRRHHPEVKSPADCDIPLCANFLAALNSMTVGQWELDSAPSRVQSETEPR
jgi:hypothetical protein